LPSRCRTLNGGAASTSPARVALGVFLTGRTELTAEPILDAPPPSAEAPEILFRSDALEVRRVVAGDGAAQVVTFESYHDDPGFARSGFGQSFFAREGLTAIHVLSAGNDWYQHAEMDEALACIRAATQGAARLLAYGSSMGGYAAIRFADAIGATHALALSPQYTIDRRRFPKERRWYNDQRRIAFRADYNGAIACRADVVVAYDPMMPMDAAHIDRIAADVPVRRLRLPHAGHPVAPFLNEVDLLQPLALDMARGSVDLATLEALAAARTGGSVTWLIERSARLPGDRGEAGLRLAEKAMELAPGNPTVLYQYGLRLHEAGDYGAAVEMHRRAVEIMPHPGFLIALSKALFFGGEPAEALAIAQEVVRKAPYAHVYTRWRGRIRSALGDHEGAANDYAAVFRMKPSLRALFGITRRHLRLWYEQAKDGLGGVPRSAGERPVQPSEQAPDRPAG